MTTLQSPAQTEQAAPTAPRTSADVSVELAQMEEELAGLPTKIETMRRAATGEIAAENIGDCFAVIEQLKARERVLRVQVWRLAQEKLRLEISEAEALLATLPAEMARALAEVETHKRAAAEATIKMDQAKRRIVTLDNQRGGAIRTVSNCGAELLTLQRNKPTV